MRVIQRSRWTIIYLFVFCLLFVPAHFLSPKIVSFDDSSYLSHAFTIGLDFDLNYKNEIATLFNRDGTIPSHPIGSGLLVAPFVAAFGLIDRLTGHPIIIDRKQHVRSWSFFGFLFAANFYFLLGVWFYYKSLIKIDSRYRVSTNLLIALSTGVIYYVLGRFTMCHAFEYFTLAATLYAAVQLFVALNSSRKFQQLTWYILMGIFCISNLWVRPANVNSLVLPYIILITLSLHCGVKLDAKKLLFVTFSLILFLLPYWIYNIHYFHAIFPSMSETYGSTRTALGELERIMGFGVLLGRNILLLVFSSEFGLIYTNPILPLGLIGAIIFICHRLKERRTWVVVLTFLILFYFAVSVSIVLMWESTGGDYGYRYLFPMIPVCLFFFVSGNSYLKKAKPQLYGIYKKVIVILLIVGVVNVFFYKVSPPLMPQEQLNVYGKWHSDSVNGYEWNLITELTKPKTYILGMGKTYFGFLVSKYALSTELVELLDEYTKDKYLVRFNQIPWVIYFQTFLLLILWMGFGIFHDKTTTRSNETRYPNTVL